MNVVNRCCALLLLVLSLSPLLLWGSRSFAAELVHDDHSTGALKVLFIGNSYTFYNDMPRIFALLVKSGQRPVKIYQAAYPNYTLKEHLSEPRTMGALEHEGPWDYVVLQERSYYPMAAPDEMAESCAQLNQKIKRAGARTILLETWADESTPWTQDVINDVYQQIGKRIGGTVCGAGEVWTGAVKSQHLYAEDGHHPSVAGSYLVACCLYKTITGRAPSALGGDSEAIAGLDHSTMRQIKTMASNGVRAASPVIARPLAPVSSNSARKPTGANNNSARGVSTYRW